MSLTGIFGQIRIKYRKDLCDVADDVDEFGKVGEDGELRKMLASPLFLRCRGDCKSSRIPTVSGKPAAMILERGASAKRT